MHTFDLAFDSKFINKIYFKMETKKYITESKVETYFENNSVIRI